MKKLTIAAVLITLLTPLTSLAAAPQQEMERMSVTYRTPLDYAIYQYTTNLLNSFKLELRADIHMQARMNIQKMAQEHGFTVAAVNTEQQKPIPALLTRAITSAE
ncbi:hypothetical protein L2755_13565 [Shewanella abyssi]|uniref:hypothetical protein n=1 Tax=Shewanella abyssi TaxID=311789 RepID=UPI002010746A|nr:hypothetical protein [Shewanella abyssi]MCL1050642.1 hypothetical protein [Shewanella abyssi]